MRYQSIFAQPRRLPEADRQQRRHALVRLSLAVAYNSWRLSRHDWSDSQAPGDALGAAP
ncbi:MAG: hypothetical protein ACWGIK_01660 [Achromobacter pulmonis]|uniref:Uncharacterized protein n=1 Tax=Achromobacter pulmonis TaxID=1389932 RepID=A0A6S7E669_9BURK|nr:hypothetical protein [Achromobacter pulmonis]CAB3691821.1 hypothetical protein LMG26696_04950 [Achromobacter pulmonis]CAB3897441.1 hypothetical protein LMG26788_04101 [Achromobacter pulmonis]